MLKDTDSKDRVYLPLRGEGPEAEKRLFASWLVVK